MLIETLTEIDELLHDLSPRIREIFLRSQLDGLTFKQLGAQLGLSVNRVQKSMLKAFSRWYASLFESTTCLRTALKSFRSVPMCGVKRLPGPP